MRKILLTPSQVSILLSSGIIFLCTLALFLSGYVIQQRTLRELRVAVRPRQARTSPKVYLPDRFKTTTRELEDGTIIVTESEAEREAREQEQAQTQIVEVAPTVEEHDGAEHVAQGKLDMLERIKAKAAKQSWAVDHPDPLAKSKVPVSRAERRRLIKQEIERLSTTNERTHYQRRLW